MLIDKATHEIAMLCLERSDKKHPAELAKLYVELYKMIKTEIYGSGIADEVPFGV
ncbi:hypothetical protein J2T12_005120 [Paenibacillus anaericanus]|uniref:hypothetical protein n=1 Tax=Paenibacillus anaericanus TaxID=170367 RepID=UPI002787C3C1|nr:hypothetical protein [Paenibacillus anaericanus]MDQ0091680.1 hypothetical protein [Paenibacillus anaericanus]